MGNPRALHIEKALDVTNLEPYHPQKIMILCARKVAQRSKHWQIAVIFTTDRIHLSGETRRTVDEESFEGIFLCRGNGRTVCRGNGRTVCR